VSIVSVYSQQQGVVLRSLLDGIFRPESFAATQAFEHKSNRELKVVQKLLETLALSEAGRKGGKTVFP